MPGTTCGKVQGIWSGYRSRVHAVGYLCRVSRHGIAPECPVKVPGQGACRRVSEQGIRKRYRTKVSVGASGTQGNGTIVDGR